MLDGVDNNETWLQTVVIFPSVDALDEFKMQTSTYSAEFGRSLGGVVNLQIKSGPTACAAAASSSTATTRSTPTTSSTTAPDATSRTSSRTSSAAPSAAPVFKDKTFFFTDYQGHRESQGQTFLSTVPSMAMRERRLLGALARHLRPDERPAVPGQPDSERPRRYRRAQHPDAAVSGAEHGGHASGANGQTINNYLINPIKERQDNQFDVKVDHNLSMSNRFFTRYSFQKTHRLQPATLPHGDAGATFGAGDGDIKAQSLAFNDTHTIGVSWLNEFRFGWSSIKFLHDADRLRDQSGDCGRACPASI